jgi:tRNA pseudouridine38-40 synthase
MPRYALKIEYDGRPFVGWQWQAAHPSVQRRLADALARIAPEAPAVTGAGRTDAGVHATGQVAHVDIAKSWEPARLLAAVNAHLRPEPVAVVAVAEVAPDFHARFGAVEREYLFRLVARRAPLVHDRGLAWRVGHRLDAAAMRAGAAALLGRHDFPTFRSSTCQAKSPVRTLDALEIAEGPVAGGWEYRFHLRARSFLHNQVRGIVGTLERVGAGSWPPGRVGEALAARDRTACGPVCPPDGLYLAAVRYPSDPFGEAGSPGAVEAGSAGAGAGASAGSGAEAAAAGWPAFQSPS